MAKSNSVWERFNDIANTEEVAEAKAQFAPLEAGTYEMKLEKIGMEETQDGLPKIAGQFRTDTNKVVFYNQNIQNINYPDMTAKNIAAAVEFCEGLLCQNIDYTTFSDFADLVDNIPTGEMHTIKVVYKKKKDGTVSKYPTLICIKKYSVEDDGDLPF